MKTTITPTAAAVRPITPQLDDAPRTQFTFDGFGINGPDKYRSRLATLTDEGQRINAGPLLAAAPELLEALDLVTRELGHWYFWATTTRPGYENSDGCKTTCDKIKTARAAIARATEGRP